MSTGRFQSGLQQNAMDLGRDLAPLMYGGADLDAMVRAGVDTARFTVDLLTGNFDNLQDSAKAMGLSFLNTVLENHYVKITQEQLYKFVLFTGASAQDFADWTVAFGQSPGAQAYSETVIGLMTGETSVKLGSALDRAAGIVGGAFDAAGRAIRGVIPVP